MLKAYKRFIDVRGRSNRKEYWEFFILNILFYPIIIMICEGYFRLFYGISILTFGAEQGKFDKSLLIWGSIIGLWFIGNIIPMWTVNIRRLHDRGISGWILLIHFIPIINILLSIFIIINALLPGDREVNSYGVPDID